MVDREARSRGKEIKTNAGTQAGVKNYISIPVENPFSKAPVWYSPATGSTMDDAAEYLAGKSCGRCSGGTMGNIPQQAYETGVSGTVFCAGYQRAGKGRLPGRSWHAEAGKNLLFTFILNKADFPHPLQLFPLLSGLALCRTLETDFTLTPRIKWPNDVLVEGRKIAGILCQMRGEWLFLGMGINCNQERFPEKICGSTTSLILEYGSAINAVGLLGTLLRAAYETFQDSGWHAEIEDRLAFREKDVEIFLPGSKPEMFNAQVKGIDREGRLRYRASSGGDCGTIEEGFIAGGEIRPVPGTGRAEV